jgi:hypothetical protein
MIKIDWEEVPLATGKTPSALLPCRREFLPPFYEPEEHLTTLGSCDKGCFGMGFSLGHSWAPILSASKPDTPNNGKATLLTALTSVFKSPRDFNSSRVPADLVARYRVVRKKHKPFTTASKFIDQTFHGLLSLSPPLQYIVAEAC